MNTSIPRIDYAAAVALWQLLLYNHSFEKSKMESITSIKIIMDLPVGVKPEVVDKIAQLMPIDLFFDGLLSYVYNDCMRDLMESISMSVEDIENPDLRHERENALMDLINDNIQDMVAAFRTALSCATPSLYTGSFIGKWKVVAVAYDSSSEALAARLEYSDEEDEEDGAVDATAIIDEENEEEEDDRPESEESEEEDESDEGSETDD